MVSETLNINRSAIAVSSYYKQAYAPVYRNVE